MRWNDLPTRRAAAVVIAVLTPYLAAATLFFGFVAAAGFCAMGGCTEPEDPGLGSLLMLASPIVLFGGLTLAARLGRASSVALRVIGAVPIAIAVGAITAQLVPSARWMEVLVLHVVAVTVIAVVVSPTGPRWWAAAALGGVLAAVLLQAFDGTPFGFLVGIAPVLAVELVPELRDRPSPPQDDADADATPSALVEAR